MLSKYATMWGKHLARLSVTKLRTYLSMNSNPVHFPPYRTGPRHRRLEHDEAYKMVKDTVAERTIAERGFPIVFALENDATLLCCVYSWKSNAATLRDNYPILRMDKCINRMGSAEVFSAHDAKSDYWQDELDQAHMDKTVLVTHNRLYWYTRMSFGLKNTTATFQRPINVILVPFMTQRALVYFEYAVIFSKRFEKPIQHMKYVLRLIQKVGMTLKVKMRFSISVAIDYLGHMIAPGRQHIATKMADAVRSLYYPTKMSRTFFFGAVQFVPPNYLKLCRCCSTLNNRMEKEEPTQLEYNDREPQIVDDLMEKVIGPLFLALPKANGKVIIETDAGDKPVSCVLQ